MHLKFKEICNPKCQPDDPISDLAHYHHYHHIVFFQVDSNMIIRQRTTKGFRRHPSLSAAVFPRQPLNDGKE